MQETVQHREIGFADLFRIVLKKFYIILLAVIIAAGIGATYAYSKNQGISQYGATANFKIAVQSQLYLDKNPSDLNDEMDPYGTPSGFNYVYTETHLSMLVEDLRSDIFVKECIMKYLKNLPDPEDEQYYNFLQYIKNCIFYSFNSNKNPNAISVTVRVSNNQNTANTLLEIIKTAVPEYIVENMIKPPPEVSYGQEGRPISSRVFTTTCEETSISRIRLLNGDQMRTAIIKFAILAGFLAAMIACIAVIALDYTDTRLRDPEDFTRRNNIRLLGVIPALGKPETSNNHQTIEEVKA